MAKDRLLRSIDVLLAFSGLVSMSPLMVVIAVLVFFDTGSPIFRQRRVGRRQRAFVLNKFRTMHSGTPSVATHLAQASAVTPLGGFLRRTKLDELPQLWDVLKGDMSLVGPRPCLFSQSELIAARAARGVFSARPGITGLAQIRGIDMSDPEKLAQVDALMLRELDLNHYLRILLLTAFGRGQGDRVKESHVE